ncbi:MAG: Lrp/AsnC family transcriptional regulator [Acidimicrobiales bacterium]
MPRRSASGSDVDEIDRRLLALLREDGRLSINEVATRASISRANAYQRLGRLRETGVIRRFTIDVDHGALGDSITAFVLVDIDQHAWRAMADTLLTLPGVEYVAFTTGTFDLVLLVRAPDMQTLRDVVLERLQSMPEVRSTQTSFVLEEKRS